MKGRLDYIGRLGSKKELLGEFNLEILLMRRRKNRILRKQNWKLRTRLQLRKSRKIQLKKMKI